MTIADSATAFHGAAYVYSGDRVATDPCAALTCVETIKIPNPEPQQSSFGWAVSGGVRILGEEQEHEGYPVNPGQQPPGETNLYAFPRDCVIVGAPHYDPNAIAGGGPIGVPDVAWGACYVYVSQRTDNAALLPGPPAFDPHTVDPNRAIFLCSRTGADADLGLSPGAHLGYAVSEAYGVLQQAANTDEELIIGAPFHDPFSGHATGGLVNGGYAFILDYQRFIQPGRFGQPGVSCIKVFEHEGGAQGERLGYVVAIGDDWYQQGASNGVPEILAAAPFADDLHSSDGPMERDGNGDPNLLPRPSGCNTGNVYILDGASKTVLWTLQDANHSEHGKFGSAIAVGNFIGDPSLDVLVGAPGTAGDSGAAFVFDGDSITAAPAGVGAIITAQPLVLTGGPGDSYGFSVANVGQVDPGQQTHDDFAIGAPHLGGIAAPGTPFVRVFRGQVQPPFPLIQQIADPGLSQTSQFGHSLAGMGFFAPADAGGDTLMDLAVGAPNGGTAGEVHIYRGESLGPNPYVTISGGGLSQADTGSMFGFSLSRIDDLTGDASAELIVGAPYDAGTAGRVYIVGVDRPTGIPFELRRYLGALPGDEFGRSVSDISDIDPQDNDLLADLIVGAPLADAGPAEDKGIVYWFTSDGQEIFLSVGAKPGDLTGFSVTRAGCYRSPIGCPTPYTTGGVEDTVIGAPGADVTVDPGSGAKIRDAGKVYLARGRWRGPGG